MKLTNPEPLDRSEQNIERRWSQRIKQYLVYLYRSKYKKISCGGNNIAKCISWARGENWRRNHQKSLNKQHKK